MPALPNLARERLSSDPKLVLVGESQKLRNLDAPGGVNEIHPTTIHTFYMGSRVPLKPDNVRSLERRVQGVARRLVDLVMEPSVVTFGRQRFKLSSEGMNVGGVTFYEELKGLDEPKGEIPTDPVERQVWFEGILEQIKKMGWKEFMAPKTGTRRRQTEILVYNDPQTAWYVKEYNQGKEQGYIEQKDPNLEKMRSKIPTEVLEGLKNGSWPSPYWATKLDRFRP